MSIPWTQKTNEQAAARWLLEDAMDEAWCNQIYNKLDVEQFPGILMAYVSEERVLNRKLLLL